MTITNMQAAALWTLAHNLGHEWAGYTDVEEMLTDGWDAVSTGVTVEMEAEHDEYSDARSSLPSGLWPATAHTTGSGRLSWRCRSVENRRVIQIEVNRPAPGLRRSNSVVLRLSAQMDDAGCWILADFESAPDMIELRHLQSLSFALYASEDECYVRHILEQLRDFAGYGEIVGGAAAIAALISRLEPEIVAAQEQLVGE